LKNKFKFIASGTCDEESALQSPLFNSANKASTVFGHGTPSSINL
jgi:hypothetical protein